MKKIIGIGVVVVISMIVSAVLFAAEPPRFNAQGRGPLGLMHREEVSVL